MLYTLFYLRWSLFSPGPWTLTYPNGPSTGWTPHYIFFDDIIYKQTRKRTISISFIYLIYFWLSFSTELEEYSELLTSYTPTSINNRTNISYKTMKKFGEKITIKYSKLCLKFILCICAVTFFYVALIVCIHCYFVKFNFLWKVTNTIFIFITLLLLTHSLKVLQQLNLYVCIFAMYNNFEISNSILQSCFF